FIEGGRIRRVYGLLKTLFVAIKTAIFTGLSVWFWSRRIAQQFEYKLKMNPNMMVYELQVQVMSKYKVWVSHERLIMDTGDVHPINIDEESDDSVEEIGNPTQ
ncbi:hypothetical protein Tco_0996412, partial [Tanacetum coccineum]